MPQFKPGVTKTAKVQMRNPTSEDLTYSGALILGSPEVVRSEQSFSIPALGEKEVAFPVTMPQVAGTYPVFIHVSSNGQVVGTYRAVEDVVIVGVPRIASITGAGELLAYDSFTINVTFDNPTDADIWLKPKYAFGKLTDGEFVAEKALCRVGYDPSYGYYMDYTSDQDWDELGGTQGGFLHAGSNMGLAKDPEGNAVKGKSDIIEKDSFWLKVPARGQATTSIGWLLAGKTFAYGARDICVKVEKAFYLVYDPGWATITVAIPPTTFTGSWTYKTVTVNWRPVDLEPFSAVAQDIATIGLAPEAITVDGLEVKAKWVQYAVGKTWGLHTTTKVTITNHTNRTFGSDRRIQTFLIVSADGMTLYNSGRYTDIPYGYPITGIPIPPGTKTYGPWSERPLGTNLSAPTFSLPKAGTAKVQVIINAIWDKHKTVKQGSFEAGFKGIFSETNQVWTKS